MRSMIDRKQINEKSERHSGQRLFPPFVVLELEELHGAAKGRQVGPLKLHEN